MRRDPHRAALGLRVTPLRPKDSRGLRVSVAIVTLADPESSRRRLAQDLHERFGLTAAEAGLAAEIFKGDGREAAAKRRGISISTARAQLFQHF